MPLLVGVGLSAGIAFLTFFFFFCKNPFKPGIDSPGATSIAGNGCT